MADEFNGESIPQVIPVLAPVDDEPEFIPDESPSHRRYWICFGIGTLIYVGLLFVGGSVGRFAAAGLQSLPFLLLAVLAYAGECRREFRPVAFIYFVSLMILVGAAAFLLCVGSVIRPEVVQSSVPGKPRPATLAEMFYPDGLFQLVEIAAAYFGIALLTLCQFLPNVRRSVAGLLPTYSDSFVHAIAVATVFAVTSMLFVPLLVLGQPPFLLVFEHLGDSISLQGMSQQDQIVDTLANLAWLVPCAILAVGFPYVRTIPESLRRVGLVRPTVAQVAFAFTAALLLVGVMTGVDYAISWLWQQMNWPATDVKAFKKLMEFGFTPLGALVVGVTAGLGEELFARGVLQPRVGIILSNLFFTAAHAPQYNWDALLSVFLIGLVLGVIRKKTNTTTSAILHGTYDFTLLFGTYMRWFAQP